MKSLFLEVASGDLVLGTASGFLVENSKGLWLVTNRHVVTGRDNNTDKPFDPLSITPRSLRIQHNDSTALGTWVPTVEPLYDENDEPLWLEHSGFGSRVDVIVLPLTNIEGIAAYPYALDDTSVKIGVAQPLSIIGFPFGRSGGGYFGIWVGGTIATEPLLDYEGLPRLLVDSRTRKGQSGSPVIYFHPGG